MPFFRVNLSLHLQPYLATLHQAAPLKQHCCISFPEEFHTHIESLLTGKKVAPMLNKEVVVAPWVAIQNLYMVELKKFQKYCDSRLHATPATVPFLWPLAQGTHVNTASSIAVPLQDSSSMHTCIAAYQEVLATATHYGLGTAVSSIVQAFLPAEPFLTSLINSLNMVKTLTAHLQRPRKTKCVTPLETLQGPLGSNGRW